MHQTMKLIDHFLQVRTKKVSGLIQYELGGKMMAKFAALRPKTYSYSMDNGNSDKKTK